MARIIYSENRRMEMAKKIEDYYRENRCWASLELVMAKRTFSRVMMKAAGLDAWRNSDVKGRRLIRQLCKYSEAERYDIADKVAELLK